MLADALGRPLKAILTPGQAHDVVAVPALLDRVKGGSVIADKGYDTNEVRTIIAEAGMQAVIPSRRSRKTPISHDPVLYRARNRIERLFGRLKRFRRLATRYDRRAVHFLAALRLVAALEWLR